MAHSDDEVLSKTLIVGVGDSGNRVLDRLIREGMSPSRCVATNTSSQTLNTCKAGYHLLIGEHTTHSLGSGGNPEVGRQAAVESAPAINDVLRSTQVVYVVCGMGGGTGTGASPVIARIAREASAQTIGVVSRPFTFEGSNRLQIAERGIVTLEREVDTLLVTELDHLLKVTEGRIQLQQAFALADGALAWQVILHKL